MMRYFTLCVVVLSSAVVPAAAEPYHSEPAPDWAARPAAATCAGLRDGVYRIVSPTAGGTLADQTSRITIDAAAGVITHGDGTRETLVAKGPCRFASSGASGTEADYVVSPAGVFGARISIDRGTSFRTAIGFPEQAHRPDELAGTWSVVGLRAGKDDFFPDAGRVTMDSSGTMTAATHCGDPVTWSLEQCVDAPSAELAEWRPSASDSRGGFTSRGVAVVHRLFLFRGGTGSPMLVMIDSDGAFAFGTRVEPSQVPPVGFSGANWNLDVSRRLGSATSTYVTYVRTTAVDATRHRWTRMKGTLGLSDEHPEPMAGDAPRSGYDTRPAGEGLTATGATVRFNEATALTLTGTGTQAAIIPKPKLFEFRILFQP